MARATAATLFDPGTGVKPERLDYLCSELKVIGPSMGAKTCMALWAAFLAIQILPLFVVGKLARFTGLRPEDRTRYLRKIEHSPLLSPLLAAVKVILSLIFFEQEDVLREAGVRFECLHDLPGWKIGDGVPPIEKLVALKSGNGSGNTNGSQS